MRTILTVLLFLFSWITVFAQSPQAFQYQAILRLDNGNPIVATEVSLKISILSDTVQNVIEYTEIQNTITDNYGRINIQVGNGDILIGNFFDINWGLGLYFVRIEFDPSGGSNYTFLGQSQLLSVPYALYANETGNEYVAGQGIEISDSTITNTGDLSNVNEIQTLSKFGSAIILNQGGGSVIDADSQTLTVGATGTVRQIQISNGNNIDIDVADNDNDASNELQVISITGDTIFLSNGGFAKLPVPTNAIVPGGGCIQSTNPDPPQGYVYSGTGFTAGDQWNTLPSMSNDRFGPAVAAVGSLIYVIGGWDGLGAVSNKLEVYDVENQSWSQKVNIPTSVVYAASAVIGNSIHVLGGYNGYSILSTHQVYNIQTNSWSQSTPLPFPRSGGGAAVVSEKIYLIGGFYDGVALDSTQMFDPSTNLWSNKTAMTTARTDFAIATLYDGIYVIGGSNLDVLNVNEHYYPETDTWTTHYPMPTYRSGCSCAVVDNKIYVLGGGDSYSYSSATEEYDALTNGWASKSVIPGPRSYFGAVSVNDQIYVVGGNFWSAINSLMVYDPTTLQFYIHCAE